MLKGGRLLGGGGGSQISPWQVFYGKFRAAAPNYRPRVAAMVFCWELGSPRPLLSLLSKRAELNETYAAGILEPPPDAAKIAGHVSKLWPPLGPRRKAMLQYWDLTFESFRHGPLNLDLSKICWRR